MAAASLVTSGVARHLLTHLPATGMALMYGSAVFKQQNHKRKDTMLDIILVVDDPKRFHMENLTTNRSHYSPLARLLGPKFVSKVADLPAYVYYNTAVRIESQLLKYGVISKDRLISDLLDWDVLYVAGRMHKPVVYLNEVDDELRMAQRMNLKSAVHAALLTLPETFSLEDLFLRITRLSYDGDFRMFFGEDKNKVKSKNGDVREISNIVKPALADFEKIYASLLRSMSTVEWTEGTARLHQDLSEATRLHHLELLPKTVQHKLMAAWRPGESRHRDVEDILKSIARNPPTLCSQVVQRSVRSIVRSSALKQSLKGLISSGPLTALSYSLAKVNKMVLSLGRKPDASNTR